VALVLAVEIAVAIWKVNYLNGFFLTVGTNPGAEYRLVMLGGLLCLALTGPGALSIDEWRNSSEEARAAGRARARKV
jgi:putative oxidoreductase